MHTSAHFADDSLHIEADIHYKNLKSKCVESKRRTALLHEEIRSGREDCKRVESRVIGVTDGLKVGVGLDQGSTLSPFCLQ